MNGESAEETIEAKGMLKGDLVVCVKNGLPNDSSKYYVNNQYTRI